MHLLLVDHVDHVLVMRDSNQRARRSSSRHSHVYPLICWMYSRGCRDGCRSRCLNNQPRIESNLILMESEWMQLSKQVRDERERRVRLTKKF